MSVEEEFMDVLQNIESVVANAYRAYPALTDYAALRTYEALLQFYSCEVTGKSAQPFAAEGPELEMLQAVRHVCEWRLGRLKVTVDPSEEIPVDPITTEEMVLCLKRLVKSVKKFTKACGRQGYLNLIGRFV